MSTPTPLAPDSAFTIESMDDVISGLMEGEKLQCAEWNDDEYIELDDRHELVDEHGMSIPASCLLLNSIFNWRIL